MRESGAFTPFLPSFLRSFEAAPAWATRQPPVCCQGVCCLMQGIAVSASYGGHWNTGWNEPLVRQHTHCPASLKRCSLGRAVSTVNRKANVSPALAVRSALCFPLLHSWPLRALSLSVPCAPFGAFSDSSRPLLPCSVSVLTVLVYGCWMGSSARREARPAREARRDAESGVGWKGREEAERGRGRE